MADYDDSFREKPSWRDRDRRKDRSRHIAQGELSGQGSSWARKEFLRRADRLFQPNRPKKLRPEQKKALDEIHRTAGSRKFAAAVRAYLEQYGPPQDWSTLLLLLEFEEASTVMSAIDSLKKLYPGQGLEEQRGLRSRLNIISMTTKDDDIRVCVEEAAKAL
jgi:hypothetical protein